MAANYWVSTQRRHWMFSREHLAEIRESLWVRDKDSSHQVQLPDMRIINIYFKDRQFYSTDYKAKNAKT